MSSYEVIPGKQHNPKRECCKNKRKLQCNNQSTKNQTVKGVRKM